MIVHTIENSIDTGMHDFIFGTSHTKEMWAQTKAIVSYEFVGSLFNYIYDNTDYGQELKEKAFHFDTVRDIGNEVGYIAGVIALTVLTFGSGSAVLTVGGGGGLATGSAAAAAEAGTPILTITTADIGAGGIAFAAGMGKNTEAAWNDGASTIKGLEYGAARGLLEGFQMFLGHAINSFKPLQKASNLLNQVGNSFIHVGLDSGDGAFGSFIEPLMQMIYSPSPENEEAIMQLINYDSEGNKINDKTYDELSFTEKYDVLFKYNGGWSDVAINGIIAGFFSAISESIDVFKAIKKSKTKSNYNYNYKAKVNQENVEIDSSTKSNYNYKEKVNQESVEIDVSTKSNKAKVNQEIADLSLEERRYLWDDYLRYQYGEKSVECKYGTKIEDLDIERRYSLTKKTAKIKAHYLSTQSSFEALDESIDKYFANNMRQVIEEESWIKAKYLLIEADQNFISLPESTQNDLIRKKLDEMLEVIFNSKGSTIREQMLKSEYFKSEEIDKILKKATSNAKFASNASYYALDNIIGCPTSYSSIENYYLDMSNKPSGGLNDNLLPEFKKWWKAQFENADGSCRVSAIYSNDSVRYVVNVPDATDSSTLQRLMMNKETQIEVDMSGKSFGMKGKEQFVSPPKDSDKLFRNIATAKEPVNAQEIVGKATGLPIKGNDRFMRVSLNYEGEVKLHTGLEARSNSQAISGGLPVYEIDGKKFRMNEGTIDSIDFSQITDWDKVDLRIDNYDLKTGDLLSTYKLKVIDGKTYLVLQK